ncbi:crotonobetainyl-CoA:carnitine CoA-transferase CaiB-like acyl-CoA transferase [Paraburkholderia sp. BL6665CI2N2]|uniref:CaiB/BaiF CoA transferase family protein n=1 Tax=Paraburkholderia sp. BL6665CI2N2 TaxID=1938806 RepID=UPI001066C480|nr:CaiB/BaiF CoA-transferase family protein [Paraburkholderia sp. BL6665CI2N2]TDY23004.1 crotonobetainyl-CoA:carnitine CoA-transferase CaiB-like acyl-CoA transferase [Paraburkholderia sp. BL6665CI2N2]
MSLPLEGIRILSLAEQYPGPFATLVMADLGADVIVVERPPAGDPARQLPDFHAALNRGKRSVGVDLKTDAGRAALRELIASADVLMEGFRPGTMARLGFGYDDVAKLNPRIVYLSISGFGQNGPYRDRPAHDLSYQAIAGLLHRQAASGQIEAPPELAIGDLSAAMFAVTGCLAALLERTRTGLGQYVDVSMTDGLVSWMSVFLSPAMNGGRLGMAEINAQPAYGVFRCEDELLLTLSIAHEDWFWAPLCELLGLTDIAHVTNAERAPREAELRARIAEALRRKPRAQWAPLLDLAGVPWGPVNSLDEVVNDPHFRARGMFREVDERGGRRAWHVAQPLVFGGVHPGPTRGVPAVGEHDAELLAQAVNARAAG